MGPETMFSIIILMILVLLMSIMNKSFKLILQPTDETTLDIIKKIHKVYLVGINNILVLYLMFLVFSTTFLIKYNFFKHFIIFINMALGFIMMVMTADAIRKIKLEAKKAGQNISIYKTYMSMLTFLCSMSAILASIMIIWFGMIIRSS